jgi:hypothetical protein
MVETLTEFSEKEQLIEQKLYTSIKFLSPSVHRKEIELKLKYIGKSLQHVS